MEYTTQQNTAPASAEAQVGQGFWARFWEVLRSSLGGVCF